MAAAIAPSTRRIYRTARQLYTRFCQSVNFDPYPASRRTLSYFVAHLVRNGKSHRTIRVYLASIYNYHTQHSLPLPTCQQELRLLLRGAMYMGKQQTNRRDAITPSILRSLYTQLSGDESTSSYNKKAFWAATTLACFACLRSNEFVSPNAKLFEPTRTLQVADFSISGTSLKVTVKKSKTDRSGSGQVLCIGSTGDTICPVKAMKKYIRARVQLFSPGPLLIWQHGQFFTRSNFTTIL